MTDLETQKNLSALLNTKIPKKRLYHQVGDPESGVMSNDSDYDSEVEG
jgi:hypothetical protein